MQSAKIKSKEKSNWINICMAEQTHGFYIQHNWLEESFANRLKEKYCDSDFPKWHLRMCGRFIAFMDPLDAEQYLESLYYTESSPFYKNKKMIRNAHIYVNGFAPDAILTSHRERSIGGASYYLSDWDTGGGGELTWFDNEEQHKQHEFNYEEPYPGNCVVPEFNKAVYWKTDGINTPIFNKWHRITRNKSKKFRVSIQMFWDDTRITDVKREYDVSKNYTTSTTRDGSLGVYHQDYAIQHNRQWMEKYSDLVYQLTGDPSR